YPAVGSKKKPEKEPPKRTNWFPGRTIGVTLNELYIRKGCGGPRLTKLRSGAMMYRCAAAGCEVSRMPVRASMLASTHRRAARCLLGKSMRSLLELRQERFAALSQTCTNFPLVLFDLLSVHNS